MRLLVGSHRDLLIVSTVVVSVVILTRLAMRDGWKVVLQRIAYSVSTGIATVLVVEVGAAMIGETPNPITVAWLGVVIAAAAARTV